MSQILHVVNSLCVVCVSFSLGGHLGAGPAVEWRVSCAWVMEVCVRMKHKAVSRHGRTHPRPCVPRCSAPAPAPLRERSIQHTVLTGLGRATDSLQRC
eukprot:scaffold34965_cov68-Phaeocystis_antarctica.AAC.3